MSVRYVAEPLIQGTSKYLDNHMYPHRSLNRVLDKRLEKILITVVCIKVSRSVYVIPSKLGRVKYFRLTCRAYLIIRPQADSTPRSLDLSFQRQSDPRYFNPVTIQYREQHQLIIINL